MEKIHRNDIPRILQGQKVRIPDLYSLFDGWNRDVNQHEAGLKIW